MDKTILVVDDEIDFLLAFKDQLTHMGYNVLTASSGAEAFDILSTPGKDIDLIIADVCMPEIDGKQILTTVKELVPETPIIIITGYDVDTAEEFARKNEANDFLVKPIQNDKLKKSLDSCLKK